MKLFYGYFVALLGTYIIEWYIIFCGASTDLVSAAADALFPLILCEQSLFQVTELVWSLKLTFVYISPKVLSYEHHQYEYELPGILLCDKVHLKSVSYRNISLCITFSIYRLPLRYYCINHWRLLVAPFPYKILAVKVFQFVFSSTNEWFLRELLGIILSRGCAMS